MSFNYVDDKYVNGIIRKIDFNNEIMAGNKQGLAFYNYEKDLSMIQDIPTRGLEILTKNIK